MFQSVRTGVSTVEEVPAPALLPGHVLVQNAASLVSAGTERMVVEFAEKNIMQKAKARPDLVRQLLDKARREGVLNTLDAVRSRLDQPLSLGYSSAGTVIAVGEGIDDIKVGDRVACSGMNYASHAEIVSVPRLLTTVIPAPTVTYEEAAFTTVGAIALHGIRLGESKLGEAVAVIGLGLIGQLTVQMLKASGCVVLGMDPDVERCRLAESFGCDATSSDADGFASLVATRTKDRGVDSVLITAASTSNDPIDLAGKVSRARAIVVAVGAVGTEVPRKTYYEKELDFRISRSYGPGRYDPEYEEKGHDYPISYVRWTESRNMEAFLQFVAAGQVLIPGLVTHRFTIGRAADAYDLITGKRNEKFMGVLISYPEQVAQRRRIDLVPESAASKTGPVRIGVLGAGLFASQVLLPAIQKSGEVELVGVCTATGGTGRHAATRFGFRYCTTDESEILRDVSVNTVLVATRHHLHAQQVMASLEAGKHLFCEKPLCVNPEELSRIITAKLAASDKLLMVGYNRRFSPMSISLKEFFTSVREPLSVHYRVNAGSIPPQHWVHDPHQGGGRVIGEVCHFVDYLIYATGAMPTSVFAVALPSPSNPPDSVVVTITFENGSIGTINYIAEGDKSFSKERVEVFGGGRVAALDDFRSLELVANGRRTITKSALRQDKGHAREWQAFATAIRDGAKSPIPLRELVAGMLATFAINESLRQGTPIPVDADAFLSPES
jgi:predicted dehydrogenase/threonine dehydrogenase-like Zn-dependent dehydrogenase